MHLRNLLTLYVILYSNIRNVRSDSNRERSCSNTINFLDAKGDFETLRTQIDDRLFIDKSLLIEEVERWHDYLVTTFSRPPKFGKSVNLNMMERFFKIPDDEHEAQINKKLFFGGEVEVNGGRKTLSKLAITDCQTIIDNHFGKHPVISLHFKNTNFSNIYEADQSMVKKIMDFYRGRKHLGKCSTQAGTDFLDDYDHSYHRSCKTDVYLKSLTEYMRKCYDEKVIILIDDYDYAINEAFLKYGPETKELKRMRAFYDDILSSIHPSKNTNVERVFLTSVMPFKDCAYKLNDIESIVRRSYSTCFGFTENEVDRLLIEFPPQSSKQHDIKKYYGQYKSGKGDIMYNTESILKCLKDNGTLNTHWETYNNLKILDQILITSPIVGEIHSLIREKDKLRKIDGLNKYMIDHLFTFGRIGTYTYLVHAGYLILDGSNIYKPNLETILILERKIYELIVTKMKLNKTEYLLEHLSQLNLHDFHIQVEDILQKATTDRLYSGEQKYYADVLESLITHGIEYQRFNEHDSSTLSERTDLLFVHTSRKGCASGVMMAIQMAKENDTNSLTVSAAQGLVAIDEKNYHDELLKKNPHIQFILKLSLSYRDGLVGMKCQIEKTKINGPNTCGGIGVVSDSSTKTHEIQITSTAASSHQTKHTETSTHPASTTTTTKPKKSRSRTSVTAKPASSHQTKHTETSTYSASTTTITKPKKSRTRTSVTAKATVTTTKMDHFKIFIKSKLPATTDIVLHDLEKHVQASNHNRDIFERYLSSKGIMNNLNRTVYHLRAAIIQSNIHIVKKHSSTESPASFSERYEHIINAVVDVLHHSYKDAGDKSTLKKVQSAFEELNLYGESSRTTKANTKETSESYSELSSHESNSDHSISSSDSHKSSEETDGEHSSADDTNEESNTYSSIDSDSNDTSDTEWNSSESSDEEKSSG